MMHAGAACVQDTWKIGSENVGRWIGGAPPPDVSAER